MYGLILRNQPIKNFINSNNPKDLIQKFATFFKKETSKNIKNSKSNYINSNIINYINSYIRKYFL